MKAFLLAVFSGLSTLAIGQNASITGTLLDEKGHPVEFANVVLYTQDSSIVKVETSDATGDFVIEGLQSGSYWLESTCIGYARLAVHDISMIMGQELKLGELRLEMSSVELETAVVTASRALVEIKPDRTVFNVQGTINSTGDNALSLLRKAPGVLVDNNNNISVLSRTGVLVYVDGKRLPLAGDNLPN